MQIELSAERLEELVREEIETQVSGQVDDIRRRLEKELKAEWLRQISEHGRGLFDATFKDLLDNGWKVTTGYGQYEKTLTLKDHCIDALVSPSGGYDRKDKIEKTIAEAVERMLRREFSATIEAAKKDVSARVDAAFIDAIKNALKTALGGGK